jgi:predicted transcriptional regulator
MEVRFSSEEQAQIARFANQSGKDEEQIVREAVELLLNNTRFEDAVRKGFASLDRGEYLEHAAVGARLERLLQS